MWLKNVIIVGIGCQYGTVPIIQFCLKHATHLTAAELLPLHMLEAIKWIDMSWCLKPTSSWQFSELMFPWD